MNHVCLSSTFCNQDSHPTCDVHQVPFPKSRAFQRPATVALIGQIQPARPEFKRPGKAPVFLIPGLQSSLDSDSIGQVTKCPWISALQAERMKKEVSKLVNELNRLTRLEAMHTEHSAEVHLKCLQEDTWFILIHYDSNDWEEECWLEIRILSQLYLFAHAH